MLLAVVAWSCTGGGDSFDDPADNTDVYLTVEVAVAETSDGTDSRAADSRADGDLTYFELPDLICEKLRTLRVIIISDGEVEANRLVKFDTDGATILNDNLTFKIKPGTKDIALYGNEMSMPSDLRTTLESATPGTKFTRTDAYATVQTRADGSALYDWRGTYLDGMDYQSYHGTKAVPMSEYWPDIVVAEPESEDDRRQHVRLFITRAVSKFSFTITKSNDGVTEADFVSLSNHRITGFTITGIGMNQYLMPTNTVYSPAKSLNSSNPYGGRYIESFDVPAGNSPQPYTYALATPCDVDGIKPGNSVLYNLPVYFPETPGGDGRFTCVINAVDKTTGQPTTLFEPVTLPNLPSLPRNTHVIVNILLTPGAMKCTVDVQPYTSVTLDPTFGFDELLPRPVEVGEVPPWLSIDGTSDPWDPE